MGKIAYFRKLGIELRLVSVLPCKRPSFQYQSRLPAGHEVRLKVAP